MILRRSIFRILGPIEFGILVVFAVFVVINIPFKVFFIANYWNAIKPSATGELARAIAYGLRFDAAMAVYLLAPMLPFYFATAIVPGNRGVRRLFQACFAFMIILVTVIWLADFQYFEESGKHLTYEATAYLNGSIMPVVKGAIELHPWTSIGSALGALGLGVLAALAVVPFVKYLRLARLRPARMRYLTLPALACVFLVVGRGGFDEEWIDNGDACISANPYLNAITLNPVFSVINTVMKQSGRPLQFGDEDGNTRVVREALNCTATLESKHCPLLRESPGTPGGNRKNVVIVILESWSAKDVGCLGSEEQLTPEFDKIAREGVLFKNFYATGIRTAEGIFSTLCSFPNQPVEPIMKRPSVYQTCWSSLSEILNAAGYRSVFIHGRGLDFDDMDEFLNYIGFNDIIDKKDFRSGTVNEGAWDGFDDEDVMREADRVFDAQTGPFLGVIYTMNSHPPFRVPDGFPKPYPADTVTHKFLNSLRYTDYTLGVFMQVARTRSYFNNTIFIFVADHTRTRDTFNFDNQHRIPMLIYAPGLVRPAMSDRVAGQLDIVPTVLGLLGISAKHASWGQDALAPGGAGFALSVAGDEVRLHKGNWLLNDTLGVKPPLLFDISNDPECKVNLWTRRQAIGESLRNELRANIALSQALLLDNRVYSDD